MNRRLVMLAAALALTPLSSACDFSEFCLTCESGAGDSDGGGGGNEDAAVFDAGPVVDACVPSGVEVCDGMDNDCNGEVDDGTLPGVGGACSTDEGECTAGVFECVAGEIVCSGTFGQPEVCDNKDNDCDGNIDNGNPGGGAICGSDQGECVSGVEMCVDGVVECVGNQGGSTEVCDGLDNDCDSKFDEMNPGGGGQCGITDVGECSFGVEACVGGQIQCQGAVNPTLELCDNLDHDCDGDPLNGFDLNNDITNCGTCGHNCNNDPFTNGPDAQLQCSAGQCEIAVCNTDFHDLDGVYINGCEYACEFHGTTETCNLEDDDCDGTPDEGVVPPPICDQDGECAGTIATCTANGFVCIYPNTVSTDANGDIIPEADCDGLNNDCDGATDEAFPQLGATCDDGQKGICRSTGTFVCNGTDDGIECNITQNGQPVGVETCNNLDDDCNGDIDENMAELSTWVDIGNGVEIMAFEAARADADTTSGGIVETNGPCAKPNALPWTFVTQPEAEAECAKIGARLCTEDEWQRACEVRGSPFPQDPGGDNIVVLEAENFDANTPQGSDFWTFDPSVTGFSGSGYMDAQIDDGDNNDLVAAINNSPRLDYQVDFQVTGTHFIWVLGFGNNSSGDDSCHAGIDGAIPSTSDRIGSFTDTTWQWIGIDMDGNRPQFDVTSTGVHTVSIWMREDGFRIDKVLLTTSQTFVPTGFGPEAACRWSFENSCTVFDPDTCNGNDHDCDPLSSGDQDCLAFSDEFPQCYADWGAAGEVHDLSGNVKEWTAERAPNVNPLRGGSFNNTADGISCRFDFTVADDTFTFPNVGFRCCR